MGEGGKTLPEGEYERIPEGADQRGQGELLSEHDSAKQEHEQVEGENKGGDRNVEIVLCGQRKPGGSAGDDAAGQQKGYDAQRIERVARKDAEQASDVFKCEPFCQFHEIPPVSIKKEHHSGQIGVVRGLAA